MNNLFRNSAFLLCIISFLVIIHSCKPHSNKKLPIHLMEIGKNSLGDLELRGRVKRLETHKMELNHSVIEVMLFDTAGFRIQSDTYYDDLDSSNDSREIYFRENNKLMLTKRFYGKEISDSIIEIRNKNGHVLEEITWRHYPRGGWGWDKKFYYYENLKVKRIVTITSDTIGGFIGDTLSDLENIFDENGKFVLQTETTKFKMQTGEISITLDKKYLSDNELSILVDSSFDSYNGRKYDLVMVEENSFDELRNCIEQRQKKIAVNRFYDYRQVYTYDDFGNWIKCENSVDGKFTDMITRKITYYSN